MIASEKLKALEAERPLWIQAARYTFLQSAPWTPTQECLNEACDAFDVFWNALPQIRAVVEAAEEAEDKLRAYARGTELISGRHSLAAALAALDEALP